MLHYDSMASLTAVLGDSPRVRVLEALVRLSGLDYTRAELAREAGLYRMTTNRMIEELERQGLVDRVGRGKRPLFRTRSESPRVQILGYLDAALGLVEEREFSGNASGEGVGELFREAVHRLEGDTRGTRRREATGQVPPRDTQKVRGNRE